MSETNAWDFFAWLNLGLFAASFSWATIGDLTQIYWLPRLNKTELMMNPRWMITFWFIIYPISSIAAWIVWRDNGGWVGSTGELTTYVIFVGFGMLWHFMLYWRHRIQFAFYLAVIVSALAVAATAWFFTVATVPGLLMLISTLWVLYVTWWNFTLVRCNTNQRGKVRKYGDRQLVFQQMGAGIPPPDTWSLVGRSCPYESAHRKFMAQVSRADGAGHVANGDNWHKAQQGALSAADQSSQY